MSTNIYEHPRIKEYSLCRLVGEGKDGATTIWKGRGPTETYYALKVIERPPFFDPCSPQILPFRSEVKLLGSLSHPHVPKLVDYYELAHFLYKDNPPILVSLLVEELSTGGDLGRIIPPKGFPIHRVAHYLSQIVEVIFYLKNKGIAHRDIKPQNFLIDNDNLKLCDFDCAITFPGENIHPGEEMDSPDESIYICTDRAGTPKYWAPEIHLEKPYNPFRSDIYSLGLLLFQLIFGSRPDVSGSGSGINWVECEREMDVEGGRVKDLVGEDILHLIDHMLHPDPLLRPSIEYIKDIIPTLFPSY